MNTKRIVYTDLLEIEFYYEGIVLGFVLNRRDESFHLLLPFFTIEVKYWRLKRRKKNQPKNFNEL